VGVGGVLAALRAQRLGPAGTLRALYAGCGPTVACSALIGAVYLCSFYHTRRWAAGRAPPLPSPARAAARGAQLAHCHAGRRGHLLVELLIR